MPRTLRLSALGQHSNGNESAVIALRPDLAYQPENPRIPESERSFARVTLLYARPEHALALEGVIREFGELSAQKGIRDPYGVFQNVTGEGPVYGIRTQARSEADFYAQTEKNNMTLGEEGNAGDSASQGRPDAEEDRDVVIGGAAGPQLPAVARVPPSGSHPRFHTRAPSSQAGSHAGRGR